MSLDDGAAPIETEALVVGAGPVGMFQVFQLGLQEIHAELVDALPHLGGQCAELYPDKPIYDIPGLPACTGAELVERLREQMAPMRPGLHLGQVVTRLQPRADGRFEVASSAGRRWLAGCVVIAGGVGAFEPRRLKLDGVEAHEGRQLHHALPPDEALAGRAVLVVGGEEPAIDTALRLSATPGAPGAPASVTLLHRRDALKADAQSLAEVARRRTDGRLQFIAGQPVGFHEAAGRLEQLVLVHGDTSTSPLAVDQVLVRLGLSPRLGAIADWGLALERKQLVVEPAGFETSQPGIHAVGDVNTYPGKKKLILCGFHEATLAAFAVAARLHPQRPQHLQYTTTSPRLQRLLGRAAPAAP
ncbi:NAD(P)/FAD-dependent oxidoreductase [Piscinibacter sakaiensis]|uniref:Ferredoxin--NADP reductase n=1 Tax=Piscinibacter sakaiensis TaxID=1547922 RepID=A0A0K8NZ86_PISS1|nr:NAD(P)/FAD-dependent oxidoreductase [Piscinibacter sakaiensis]GAP35683.1 thioredoxin reductase [Piscinibacter sakaiensis]